VIALGFNLANLKGVPYSDIQSVNTLIQEDFPDPVGPISMKPCLTANVS
jgi:hypothetical protein